MQWFVFSAFLAVALAGTDKWTSLTVKYGATEAGNDDEHFWKVPLTLTEALASRWQHVIMPNNLEAQYVGVSATDYGFNPIYDSNGFLAGAQMCQPLWTVLISGPPGVIPTTSGTNEVKNIDGVGYFCSTFLLIDPTVLRSGGRSSANRLGDGLWIRDTSNRITGFRKIPDDADILLRDTAFTWQNCFPAMGKHYFYNFTHEFDCNDFNSWFLLGQENDVTGIGWQLFGQKTVFHYNWFDFLPRVAAEMIAPVVNVCLYDWIDQYTIISIHVYFTKEPWGITCSEGDSVETKQQQVKRLAQLRSKQ